MTGRVERVIIGLGALYVLALGWAMVSVSYDVWGAFVLLPLVVVVTLILLRRVFPDEFSRMYTIAALGLAAKLVAVIIRYWVAFQSYGGYSDSGEYDLKAKALVASIRSGAAPLTSVIPAGTGTEFTERLTASVYMVSGTSRLGGFFVFAMMAYWGAVFFLRAAMISVPGLSSRRYAVVVFFTPSILYWPASIGKEAWLFLCLGIASYGVAKVLVGRWEPSTLLCLIAGLVGAGMVRPHFSAMWLAALVVALMTGLFTRRSTTAERGRFVTVVLLGLFVGVLLAVGSASLRFIAQESAGDTAAPVSDQVTTLFASTAERTVEGGSGFAVVAINGPSDWPYAIARTLTRPLLNEASTIAELIPAIEMTAIFVLAVVSWRRLFNVFHVMRRSPYLVFAGVTLLAFGLAFASVGNLGILTRQRSLIMPMFLLPFAIPPRKPKRAERPSADAGRTHSAGDTSSAALIAR